MRYAPVSEQRALARGAAALLGILFSVACVASPSRHVVVVVWDGMRPDFINEQNTPTLLRLAHQGVRFPNHHSVFLTSTEVNAAAMSTGAYPSATGLIGNEEYRPRLDPLRSVSTQAGDTIRQGDQLSGGHFLRLPTLPELVRRHGGRAVVAGAKSVALLADRAPRTSPTEGIILYAGHTLPTNLIDQLTERLGRFPISNATNSLRDDWTTRALTDVLWAEGLPDFSLLWLNQPDYAQHETGPGSEPTLAAIRGLDQNLATLLQALESKGVRQSTDVIVLSDHGFSTVQNKADLAAALRQNGFKATRQFDEPPQNGQIIVVSNGGTSFIYVIGHEASLVRRVVAFLQQWEFSGVIFTRNALPGTFRLKQLHLDAEDAPDVLVSLRWSPLLSTNGTPGLVTSDSGYGPGQGTHGSLSPFDLHGFMVASGPDFRVGVTNDLPSGNLDIAPTVLNLLGIRPPKHLAGRVLSEALTFAHPLFKPAKPRRIAARSRVDHFLWEQYLRLSACGAEIYCDEGGSRRVAQ